MVKTEIDTICYDCGNKGIIKGKFHYWSMFFDDDTRRRFIFDPVNLPMKWHRSFSYKGVSVDSSVKCCVACGLLWTKLKLAELNYFILDKGTDTVVKSIFMKKDSDYFNGKSEDCKKCSSIKTIKGKISFPIQDNHNATFSIRFSTGNYRKSLVIGRPLLNEYATCCTECGYVFTNISPMKLLKFILKNCETGFIINNYYEKNMATENKLVLALKEKESHIRKSVAAVLGLIGDKRAMPSLILLLNDHNKKVRETAKRALNLIDSLWIQSTDAKNQIPKFIETLKAGKLANRHAATEALGLFGGNEVVKALINYAVSDKSRKIRLAAIKALRRTLPFDERINNSHPNLFCVKCLRRSKRIVRKSGLFGKAVFVYCPKCYETKHLAKGIKTVVGEIGGTRKEIDAKGDKAIVSLWAESEKAAFPADVDLIMVRNNGIKNIHRALNSVILELKSIEGKQEDWVRQTPVKFERGLSLTKLETNMINNNFEDVAFDFEPDL